VINTQDIVKFDANVQITRWGGFVGAEDQERVRDHLMRYKIEQVAVSWDEAACGDTGAANTRIGEIVDAWPTVYGFVVCNPAFPEEAARDMRAHLRKPRFLGASFGFSGYARRYDLSEIRTTLTSLRRFGKIARVICSSVTDVRYVGELASEYSPMKFVAVARNWESWLQLITVAAKHPGIYLDISGEPYRDRVRKALEEIGPHRLLFATRQPYFSPAVTLAMLEDSLDSEEIAKAVLYQNAQRLFRLDADDVGETEQTLEV
jgi:predicted TIM-barrel fold metal-dependent hydrolase